MGWLWISIVLIVIGLVFSFKEFLGLSALFMSVGIGVLVICGSITIIAYATHETKYLDTVEYRQLMDNGSNFGAVFFNKEIRLHKMQSQNPIWGSMFYGNLQDIEEIPLN